MNVLWSLSMFVIFSIFVIVESRSSDKVLSRKKRYLTFPEGSSLSIAICTTVQTGITPGGIFSEGINWGIAYDLPNSTDDFKDLLKKPKKTMQRRHRRDLYSKMEMIMNSMGYNGRSCILRSLCEAARHLRPRGESLVDEILRIVFSYPTDAISRLENRMEETHQLQYHKASHNGLQENAACSDLFPGCPFSLIDMALGYYSDFAHYSDR